MHTVVVTGADEALGRTVADGLASDAACLVLGVRDLDSSIDLEAAFEVETHVVRADPRDEFDTERLMEQASRAGDESGISLVAPCAQVYHGSVGETPLDRTPYSAFDDTFRTNARGVFAAITEALPHLHDDGRVLVPTGTDTTAEAPGYGAFAVAAAATEAVVRGFTVDRDLAAATLAIGDAAGTSDFDESEAAALFSWAASLPAADLDGRRLTAADRQVATQ